MLWQQQLSAPSGTQCNLKVFYCSRCICCGWMVSQPYNNLCCGRISFLCTTTFAALTFKSYTTLVNGQQNLLVVRWRRTPGSHCIMSDLTGSVCRSFFFDLLLLPLEIPYSIIASSRAIRFKKKHIMRSAFLRKKMDPSTKAFIKIKATLNRQEATGSISIYLLQRIDQIRRILVESQRMSVFS